MTNSITRPRLTALCYFIMAALALRVFIQCYRPYSQASTRLWLEWLGRQILQHGAIPHAAGHEALASAGSAWIPQSWLMGLFLAWCAMHSLDILPIIVLTCLAVVPVFVTYRRMQGADIDAVGRVYAMVLVSLAVDLRMEMRAAVVACAASAVVFAAIGCNDRRQYYVPVVVLALINIHATAVFLGWLPALVFAATCAIERSWSVKLQRLLITSIASVLATLCSPFGFFLYTFTFTLTGGALHKYFAEWTPILFDLQNQKVVFAHGLLMVALIIAWRRSRPVTISEACILAATGALMLYAERFAPLFIFAAAPLALRDGLRLPTFRFDLAHKPIVAWVLVLCLLWPITRLVATHVIRDRGVPLAQRPGLLVPPDWLLAWRIGKPARERVFCSNYSDCNSFLWAGAGTVVDGRADLFPVHVFASIVRINDVEPGWQSEIARLGVNVLVLRKETPQLIAAVAHLSHWHKAGTTEPCIIFTEDTVGRSAVSPERKIAFE